MNNDECVYNGCDASITVNDNGNDVCTAVGHGQKRHDVALEETRELAQRDAPDEFCSACVEDTPLAYSNARDIHTINAINHIVDSCSGPDDADVVRDEIEETYIQAYRDACAEPENCEVCSHREAYNECGHERVGEECPVR